MPLSSGEAFPRGTDPRKHFAQPFQSMRGQVEGHLNSVEIPPQEALAGGPGGIALEKLLDGGWFFPVRRVARLQLSEYIINGMQCGSKDPFPLMASLRQQQKIVDINVDSRDRMLRNWRAVLLL